MRIIFLWLVAIISFIGCEYNVEEELYPPDVCEPENVSYSTEVVPILEQRCFPCHTQNQPDGGVILEGYDNFIIWVDLGFVVSAIRHESGFSPMPKDKPQLPDCEIKTIATWVEEGALEN